MSPDYLPGVVTSLLVATAGYALWWLDRYRLEALTRYALVVASGVALALGMAAWGWPAALEAAIEAVGLAPGYGLLLLLAAPVVVRAVQAVLVVTVAGRFLESPVDGVVLGLASGSGMAGVMTVMASMGATPGPAADVLAYVAVSSGAGALIGLGLAGAVAVGSRLGAVCSVVLGIAAGVGLDLVSGARLIPAAWLAGLGALVVAGALVGAAALEFRLLRRELAEEVALGVLPEWVVQILPAYHRRVRPGWWPRRDERRVLVRHLVGLAVRRHRLRRLGGDHARLRGLEVGKLRERVRRLLAPQEPAPSPWEEE